MAYSAPTAKGTTTSRSGQPLPILVGYDRFTKPIDFGVNNCFDFEEALSFLCAPVVTDEKNRKGLIASPVFLVDPCQSTIKPLKTQTIYPAGTDIKIPQNTIGSSMAGVFTGAINDRVTTPTAGTIAETWSLSEQRQVYRAHTTGAVATPLAHLIDARNMSKSLALNQTTTGGVGTSSVTVEVSVDNSNFLLIDTLAAAATVTKQYVEATVGATLAISPLTFPYIRITSNANSTASATAVIDIAMK